MPTKVNDIYYVDDEGLLRFKYHKGQRQAHRSRARTVLVLAGTQSGKTVYGPWWLFREIMKEGPGDYLVATPDFQLLEKKALKEFKLLFEKILSIGSYTGSPIRQFVFNEHGNEMLRQAGHKITGDTTIVFGHARNPESLESATYKAAWLDEAGQKQFKEDSKEAIDRRLLIHQGRTLITTTPYYLGWLKKQIHDESHMKGGSDTTIDVISFESRMNPAFPEEEWERQRKKMRPSRFNLFYKAIWDKPEGLVFDCFNEREHVVRPFEIPRHWNRYMGVDFGSVNMASVFVAKDPQRELFYVYKEYHDGRKSIGDHVQDMLAGEPTVPYAMGGAPSEDQMRWEFSDNGLSIDAPDITSVEVGIDRLYGLIKRGHIRIFSTCTGLIDELNSCSYELDDNEMPTDVIEDKSIYHKLDSLRYIGTFLADSQPDWSEVDGYFG